MFQIAGGILLALAIIGFFIALPQTRSKHAEAGYKRTTKDKLMIAAILLVGFILAVLVAIA